MGRKEQRMFEVDRYVGRLEESVVRALPCARARRLHSSVYFQSFWYMCVSERVSERERE